MSKDFSKFAYFVSKARNFAIVIKPDKKKIVDGEVVFEPGLRMEFNNGMLSVEKTKENEGILKILRGKIEDEKILDPKKRSFWEEQAPKEMVEMEKVKEVVAAQLDEKNKKIAELEAEIKKLKK